MLHLVAAILCFAGVVWLVILHEQTCRRQRNQLVEARDMAIAAQDQWIQTGVRLVQSDRLREAAESDLHRVSGQLAAVTVERDSYRDLANSRWDGWVRGLWAISDLRDRLAEARDDCEKAQAGRIREAKRYDEMLKYACNLENKLGEMRVRIAGLTGALAIERDTLTQALAQRDAVAKRCKELRCKYRILYSHYLELPVAMASKYDELQCKLNMANATVKEQMDALAERDEDIADLRAVYSAMNEHHEAKLAELAAAKAPKRKSRK